MPHKPDYSIPTAAEQGFHTPLREDIRFSGNKELFLDEERRQSGGLSDDPGESNPCRPLGKNSSSTTKE